MAIRNDWIVADTTARDALEVNIADVRVGNECQLLTTGAMYRPVRAGTGSLCWRRSDGDVSSLRAPATIACLGDSHSERNSSEDLAAGTGKPLWRFRGDGYLTWANIYLGQRFCFEHALNFGVSGETTVQILARVDTVIAAAPDVCVVLGGTNDITAGVATATITGALQDIYEALRAAGILVVAITIPPRASGTATQRRTLYAVNRWIRKYCIATPGMLLADAAFRLTNPTSATGEPVTGVLVGDGIHFDVAGAQIVGETVALALASVSAPKLFLPACNDDAYEATLNPEGNLIANGAMSGTAGTPTAPATGSVADSWTFLRTSGTHAAGTAVASKEARTDGPGDWQVLTFAGLTGGALCVYALRQYVNASGIIAQGDVIEAEVEIEVSGAALLGSVELRVREYDGSNTQAEAGCCNYSLNTSECEDFSGILRTPRMTWENTPGGSAQVQVFVMISMNAGGAGAAAVVKIGRVDLRKVIS